jgi:aerobic C4-dicarboxylate transport protein
MALILGIDRFMSAGRAVVNIIGNAVAAVVMASLEGELDGNRMLRVLSGAPLEDHPAGNTIRAHVQCAPGETNPGTPI